MIRLISRIALLALPFGSLHAQQIDVDTGTRVRVLSGSARVPLTGTIIAQRADSLILRDDGSGKPVSFALSSINHLQIGHRTQNGPLILAKAGAGLLFGVAAGALVGPIVTSGACLSVKKDLQNLFSCSSALMKGTNRGRAALVGGLGGAVIGAVAGLVTGAERWEEMEMRRVQPMIALDHDAVGVSLTVRF